MDKPERPNTTEAAKMFMAMNRKDRRMWEKRLGIKIPGSQQPIKN